MVTAAAISENFDLLGIKVALCHYFSKQVSVFSPVRLQKLSGFTSAL
jgi:hypothetical protein